MSKCILSSFKLPVFLTVHAKSKEFDHFLFVIGVLCCFSGVFNSCDGSMKYSEKKRCGCSDK